MLNDEPCCDLRFLVPPLRKIGDAGCGRAWFVYHVVATTGALMADAGGRALDRLIDAPALSMVLSDVREFGIGWLRRRRELPAPDAFVDVQRSGSSKAVHRPRHDLAGWTSPENVRLAVSVDVTDAENLPERCRTVDQLIGSDRCAVQGPDHERPRWSLQEQISVAVAVEIARAGDPPGGCPTPEELPPQHRGALHEPDNDLARRRLPDQIGVAVAVDVAHSDDTPIGRAGVQIEDRRLGGPVIQPDRHSARW